MPGQPLIYQNDVIVASPAAGAETVVCRLEGVASRYGNPVKLSGWVNVTPDTDATAIVLRVRRGTTTGGTLVTPAETVGFGGAGASGGLVAGTNGDTVFADAATSVPADNGNHAIPFVVAAPPAWLDGTGQILAEGLYEVMLGLRTTTPATVPGLTCSESSPNEQQWVDALDQIASPGPLHGETIVVATADLPYAVAWHVKMPTDVTGVVDATPAVSRLATVAGAGGGGVTPGDAVLDVIDLPGQIAQASYVLTAQMTGANSPSTINGVKLTARID